MKQFILKSEPGRDGIVRLEGDDYHYLVRVRRLATGEYFPALLPNGEETLVQIQSIDRSVITGKCGGSADLPVEGGSSAENTANSVNLSSAAGTLPPIILFQAMPKGDKMDLIVRQAAEGGITEIVPFVSEFSVAKTGAKGQKFSRWERIIKEARQQSGSMTATALHEPLTIKEVFNYWKKINENGALGLLFHHEVSYNYVNSCEVPRKGLEKISLHGYLKENFKIVALAIGPEGGFSDKEVSLFTENGFKPLTIGDTILRTETAALYCAAAIRIILLERETWELSKARS